jgi:hypothetical protein
VYFCGPRLRRRRSAASGCKDTSKSLAKPQKRGREAVQFLTNVHSQHSQRVFFTTQSCCAAPSRRGRPCCA